MPDSFSFGNIITSDYGIMAFPATVVEGPERAYEYTPIPGRSGDLIIHDHRINNSIVNYGCIFCPNDNGMYGNYTSLEEAVTAFHSGLLSKAGYYDLSDTFNTAYFRKASFPGPLEITYSSDKRLAKCIASFNCKPQKYLTSGAEIYTFNSSGQISNPTPFNSQPLIRVYGAGSLEINGTTVTIDSVGTSYTDIDCELMDCYEGNANRNAYVSFSTYNFPVLAPGANDVNIIDNTITTVEIKPRWWMV